MDCLFCKIAQGIIPASVIHQDEKLLVFQDIAPKAPVHWLIIPKKHLTHLSDAKPEDTALLGQLLFTVGNLANTHELTGKGYRIVTNCNAEGGQTVFHLHFHLLAGRQLDWPPG